MWSDKGLCYQCLSPGANVEHGKHRDGLCYSRFVCKHKAHSRHPRKKHVLCCEEHKTAAENSGLLEEYKKSNILSIKSSIPEFSKQIKLNFHCDSLSQVYKSDLSCDLEDSEVIESSIYILQTIQVEDRKLNIFFDSGCGDLVRRKEAVMELEELGKACLLIPGPVVLGGVGDVKTESQDGIYKVDIPLSSGKSAVMRGVCLNQITVKFPMYPLQTKVQKDIAYSYKLAGKILKIYLVCQSM